MRRAELTRRLFDTFARAVPGFVVGEVYRRLGRDHDVTLCLHRFGPRRASDPYPDTTAEAAEVDAFLVMAARAQARGGPRLSMSFDDGYADAVEYVASRAPRFPAVEWLIFVCPEKIEKRVGYRWDLYERLFGTGKSLPPLRRFLEVDADPERENQRQDLRETAQSPLYALATVPQCRDLLTLPNVALGNHTSSHIPLTAMTPVQAAWEIVTSNRQFATLFGPARLFAFPFGRVGAHFGPEHVAQLEGCVCYSTEDGLYRADERRPGAVLPRIIFRGSFSGKAMALWVAWCALKGRWARVRPESRGLERVRTPAA